MTDEREPTEVSRRDAGIERSSSRDPQAQSPGSSVSAGPDEPGTVRESLRELNSILSSARHDINNQLTILNGYLTLLESPPPSLQTGDIIRILQGATQKIEQILRFTREYQGIGEKPPSWQPLGETICRTVKGMNTGAVRVVTDPSCDTVDVYADARLGGAFAELIDNSVRHGGSTVSEVRIGCSAGSSGLRITLADNGAGIPGRIRPVLFEHSKGKNAGYGLFLAGRILAVTGIAIAEKGNPGSGAYFEMTVPLSSFRITGGK